MSYQRLKVLEDARTYKALVYMPEKHNEREMPLLLYLHGAGEMGSDIRHLVAEGTTGTPSHAIEFGTAPKALLENFVVVAPQSNTFWEFDRISNFIEFILAKFPSINNRRLYITGHSMGGSGALYIAAKSKKFAACVPVAPAGGVSPAELLDIPIWAFHGRNDLVVPSHYTEHLIKTLRAAGVQSEQAKLTLYPDAPTPPGWPDSIGHASTIPAYATDDLYSWLLVNELPIDRTPFVVPLPSRSKDPPSFSY